FNIIFLHQVKCLAYFSIFVNCYQPATPKSTQQITHCFHIQEPPVQHPLIVIYLTHVAAAMVMKDDHYHVRWLQPVFQLVQTSNSTTCRITHKNTLFFSYFTCHYST